MSDQEKPPSLDQLDAKLREARERLAGEADRKARRNGPGPTMTGFGLAFRVGTELVAGLAVGAGVGYLLDRWWGTGPWMMVVFFFLGSAAGILNVYRAMGDMSGRSNNDRT